MKRNLRFAKLKNILETVQQIEAGLMYMKLIKRYLRNTTHHHYNSKTVSKLMAT